MTAHHGYTQFKRAARLGCGQLRVAGMITRRDLLAATVLLAGGVALAQQDSPLAAQIRANPQAAANLLLAEPFFASFNTLWKSPDHLIPTVNYFALTSLDALKAFAAALQDGSGWVTHRDRLLAWINPRPGVRLDEMEAAPWSVVESVLIGGAIPTNPVYWVQPNDGTVYLPTIDQFTTIMGNCPAARWEWKANDLDCDDHVRILRGWLSEHGLGPAAIGFGGYQAFNSNGAFVGAHAIGLAICADRRPWIGEPRDGRVYPISTVNLGGFITAHHVGYTLAQF